MPEGLMVTPVITGTAELRRASSSCCDAKLSIKPVTTATKEPSWLCRECGQLCDRILSEPEQLEITGYMTEAAS